MIIDKGKDSQPKEDEKSAVPWCNEKAKGRK